MVKAKNMSLQAVDSMFIHLKLVHFQEYLTIKYLQIFKGKLKLFIDKVIRLPTVNRLNSSSASHLVFIAPFFYEYGETKNGICRWGLEMGRGALRC